MLVCNAKIKRLQPKVPLAPMGGVHHRQGLSPGRSAWSAPPRLEPGPPERCEND
jgi:hypothetical protein